MKYLLNVINHLLAYSDGARTDNPHMKALDHRRRMEGIPVENPDTKTKVLRAGETFSIAETQVATGLSLTSVLDLTVANQSSVYRLKLVSGTGSFKTERAVTGLANCAVTINNNTMAVFDFAGATLTAVLAGDIMRIKGDVTFDTGPFVFNPVNSGIWKVLAVSGTKVSAVRTDTQLANFQGIAESVTGVSADVSFYADDKVMTGNSILIQGAFSPASFRAYSIVDVTPTEIFFVSTQPVPEETAIAYQTNGIIVYTAMKKIVYIESDQEVVVRFNGATDNSNKITPIKVNDFRLPAYFNKSGEVYSCEIYNSSLSPANILYFTCE